MVFNYLKYVSPVWYFNLPPAKDHQYFPTEQQLKSAGINLTIDEGFTSQEARQRDLAWRAFKQGWMATNNLDKGLKVWEKVKLPVEDEYRFIRKYYSSVWSGYILALRLLSLKNPVREIRGYFKSSKVKRDNIYAKPLLTTSQNNSKVTNVQHKVSIIIPTLNRYPYLKDVLDDIGKQHYQNFEVIVVDQSEPFQATFYKQWSYDIKVIQQQEKALWLARNTAIKMATGDLILLFDDDSRVEADWIDQHIHCLYDYDADISSGVSISKVGDKVPENYKYFRWSDQVDTGNVMVKKHVFEKLGLFDRQFEKQRMGDGEFGLRAYLAGYRNVSNP
ncbi:MAG: glycosyltransferase family 2 protein, partial [Flavipsychrobacter sp.]